MLALASSCAAPGVIPPPAEDLKAAIEAKPEPADDIATSQQAYDEYQARLEAWGDRLYRAGGRICRWSKRIYKLRIDCPPAEELNDGR
jgi:hypothetical protein